MRRETVRVGSGGEGNEFSITLVGASANESEVTSSSSQRRRCGWWGGGGSDPQTPKSDDGGANTRTNSARSTPPTNVSTPLTDVTGYGEDSKRDDDEMFLVSFDPKTPEIPRGSSMKGIERWGG